MHQLNIKNYNKCPSHCPTHKEEDYSGNITISLKSYKVKLLADEITAKILLSASPTVRIHTRLGRETWARLFYLYRFIDTQGSGNATVPLELVTDILDCDEKSVYRWLQDGRRVGAFRRYKVRSGMLKVWLGSLFKLSWNLNYKHWGTAADVPFFEINTLLGLRSTVTATVTEKLQQQSRYAKNVSLDPKHRKLFGAPHPNELLMSGGQYSHKTEAGQLPFIYHVSASRVFVTNGFAVYGASQRAIADQLMISSRTARRHQDNQGMERKQLCVNKEAYGWIANSWKHEIQETSHANYPDIGYKVVGDEVLFSDGVPLGLKKAKAAKKNRHVPGSSNEVSIPVDEFGNRFFRWFGKWWMSKCNIYRETIALTTMRAARRKFKFIIKKLSQCQLSRNAAGEGESFVKKD